MNIIWINSGHKTRKLIYRFIHSKKNLPCTNFTNWQWNVCVYAYTNLFKFFSRFTLFVLVQNKATSAKNSFVLRRSSNK